MCTTSHFWSYHVPIACDASLGSKELREEWEKIFYQACALPILQNVQVTLQNTLDLIANDDSQGNPHLMATNVLCHKQSFRA